MYANKLGYQVATQAAGLLVKSGPAGFFGFTVTASTAGTITVYDGLTNAGTVVFTKTSLAVGEVVHFGGNGLALNTGLYVVAGGTATIVILYT